MEDGEKHLEYYEEEWRMDGSVYEEVGKRKIMRENAGWREGIGWETVRDIHLRFYYCR